MTASFGEAGKRDELLLMNDGKSSCDPMYLAVPGNAVSGPCGRLMPFSTFGLPGNHTPYESTFRQYFE